MKKDRRAFVQTASTMIAGSILIPQLSCKPAPADINQT